MPFIPAQASSFLQTAITPQGCTMVSVPSAQKVRVWLSGFSRPSFIRLVVAGVFVLSSLWLFYGSFTGNPFSRPRFVLGDEVLSANPSALESIPQTHSNVVVASAFGAHFDVYMTVAWTLQRIMVKEPGNLQVYAPTPFLFNFQEVVDRYGLYKGEIKDPIDLLGDIKNGGHDAGIDLMILGTCEIEYVLSSSHSAYTVRISLFWCLTVCHIGTRSSLLHGMLAMLDISSRSFALFITPTMRGGNLSFRSGLDGMLFVFFLSQNSKFLVSPFNHV